METILLLTTTGLGLGAIYFLIASGLSLIYGLMQVLNFAHGVFLTLGAYLGWEVAKVIGADSWLALFIAAAVGAATGAVFATLTELILIRRLYERHIEQVLVTVGLALASVALFEGTWGSFQVYVTGPSWLEQTSQILGAAVPNVIWVVIATAVILLVSLQLFLKYTRYGMIIRAGVENRNMVTALGIDVRKAFTLVFTIGGAAAGLGGVMAMHYFGYVSPHMGQSLLIFAFIVTVIGGLGSIPGAAIASVVVALIQQFANFYAGTLVDLAAIVPPIQQVLALFAGGLGDIAVVILLALVLLFRPSGLLGRK